jgi:MSHA biogenesis protein MshI
MAVSLRDDGLYLAHVRRDAGSKPVVTHAAYYPNTEANLAALTARAAHETGLGHYQCTLVLNPGQYQIITVDAPNVQPEEIKNAIRWRIKDMIDFRVDDASVDVLDIPVPKDAAARGRSMFAVAARNQLIEERIALFSAVKVPVGVVDIPDIAQRNVSALLEPEQRAVACLTFSDNSGLLTVSYGGELYLTRRIDILPADLQTMDEDRRRSLFDRIALEVQRSLDHVDRQFQFITIAKLVLGPMNEDNGLAEYLRSNLYVPVEQPLLETLLDTTACPLLKDPGMQQRFFTTIGAALRLEEKEL